MPVETFTNIGSLNPLWPLGSDPKSAGDDHIRGIKAVMQSGTQYQGKSGAYTAVAGDVSSTLVFSAAATLSLTAAATLKAGWTVNVIAASGDVVIDPNAAETIDGFATVTIPSGGSCRIYCDGGGFVTDRTQNRGFERIAAGTATSGTNVDFINLAAYRQLRLSGHLVPAADTAFQIQVSTNNGTSYDSSSSYVLQNNLSKGAAFSAALSSPVTAFYLNAFSNIKAANFMGFTMNAFEFNQASAVTVFTSLVHFVDPTSSHCTAWNSGTHQVGVVCNALRLLLSAGAITRLTYLLEGVRG